MQLRVNITSDLLDLSEITLLMAVKQFEVSIFVMSARLFSFDWLTFSEERFIYFYIRTTWIEYLGG